MKKNSILLLVSLFVTFNFFSQNCDYETFSSQLQRSATKKDSSDIILAHFKCIYTKQNQLDNLLIEMSATLNDNNEYVQEEKRDFEKIYSEKHESLKKNLLNVPDIFEEVNDNIYTIKSRLVQHDLENYIKELYNPESSVTGKKFSQILYDQIKLDVIDKMGLNSSQTSKVLKTAESITNTPLLQAIPSFQSAIKITTEVISFIRNVIFKDDIKNLKLLQNFEKNISKYLVFYGELENANQEYQFNLNEVQARIDVVYINYNDYLIKTSKIAGFEYNSLVGESNLKLINDDLITKLNVYLNNKASSLNNDNYFDDLKSNKKLIKFNNDLDNLKHFINEFKEIFELYNSINNDYKNRVIITVDKQGQNILDNKKEQIRSKLNQLQAQSNESTNALVNLKNLKQKLKNIEFSDIHL